MDENSQILTFLDFELLIDQRLLKRTDSEQTVRLSNSESLLLQFLAQTPGETVSRETLLSECWPGRIVTQSSLNVAIKNLRQAFEQLNSESPIVTDLGKGYSLRGESWPSQDQVKPEGPVSTDNEVDRVSSLSEPLPWEWVIFSLGFISTLYALFLYTEIVETTKINGVITYYDGFALDETKLSEMPGQADFHIIFPKGGAMHCYQVLTYSDDEFVELNNQLGQCDDE